MPQTEHIKTHRRVLLDDDDRGSQALRALQLRGSPVVCGQGEDTKLVGLDDGVEQVPAALLEVALVFRLEDGDDDHVGVLLPARIPGLLSGAVLLSVFRVAKVVHGESFHELLHPVLWAVAALLALEVVFLDLQRLAADEPVAESFIGSLELESEVGDFQAPGIAVGWRNGLRRVGGGRG